MELSKTDRWILSNQYKILEQVHSERAESYATKRKALEEGHEIVYSWISEHISENELSEAECAEVLDILTMYEMLQVWYDRLEDPSQIDVEEDSLKFPGFDGNSRGRELAFFRFLIEEQGKFSNLDLMDGTLNSHFPFYNQYKKMLKIWEKAEKKHELKAKEIEKIVNVEV